MGKQPYRGNLNVPSDQSLMIGNYTDGNLGARGAIGYFRVYKKPLSGERVSQLAASGFQ